MGCRSHHETGHFCPAGEEKIACVLRQSINQSIYCVYISVTFCTATTTCLVGNNDLLTVTRSGLTPSLFLAAILRNQVLCVIACCELTATE